jgi:hypothetical protein
MGGARVAARGPFFLAGADADADADADANADVDADDEDAESGAPVAVWPIVESAEAETTTDVDADATCEEGRAITKLGSADGEACATARDTASAAALSPAPLRQTSSAETSDVTGRTFKFQPFASAVP